MNKCWLCKGKLDGAVFQWVNNKFVRICYSCYYSNATDPIIDIDTAVQYLLK